MSKGVCTTNNGEFQYDNMLNVVIPKNTSLDYYDKNIST
jgi:hypothetical protein